MPAILFPRGRTRLPLYSYVFSYQIELPFVSRIFWPYASLMPASIQPAAKTPRARAKAKSTNLACMRCVHSNLMVFAEALEGTGSKNIVCLPAPIQFFFLNNTNIARRILRGRNLNFARKRRLQLSMPGRTRLAIINSCVVTSS